ncbi:MarR family EPS-associated transcriptional regulator [Roseobacter sp. HKCCA2468]|uniref:MarR family EPS-associated transcriptional regulator n=1 Tax=Roseobacter sp. HKCCA2468 TaxID=3120342 RepID=UPI0030EB4981
MASVREDVALERTFQCMCLIHKCGDISTRELAERMKISNGAAYYVLSALIEKGYVKAESFKNNTSKSRYFYLLTPAGLGEKARLTAKFIRRKKAEYQALKVEIEVLEREYAAQQLSTR